MAPGPRSGLLLNLIYINTHRNLHSRFVTQVRYSSGPRYSQGGATKKKKKKKVDLVASSLPHALVIFLFPLPLLGLQG